MTTTTKTLSEADAKLKEIYLEAREAGKDHADAILAMVRAGTGHNYASRIAYDWKYEWEDAR